MNFGPGEWIVVLVVILLLFGARKIPDLARSLGQSAKEFRHGLEEGSSDDAETTTNDTTINKDTTSN